MARAFAPPAMLAAETIRAAYADVFQYIDPTTATAAEIEGQFRNYTPRGQLHRMVALFRSLCVYAEIIPSDQAQTLGAEPRPRRPQATTPRKPRNQGSRRDQAPPPKPGGEGDRPPQRYGTRARDAGDLHPFILTLLEQLPEVGAEWSAADRKAWTSFAESGFNLLYRLPSDDGGGGSD